MINMITNLIKRYREILTWRWQNGEGKLIVLGGLLETLDLAFRSYIIAIIIGFWLGLFLYKQHLKKNKIQKFFYVTITKIIHTLTHIPFMFFSLFVVMCLVPCFTTKTTYDQLTQMNEENMLFACSALTIHLALMFAKKIEKIFSHHKKNTILPIKKILKDKKIYSDLVSTTTYLFISGILYSTIAGGSFGGKINTLTTHTEATKGVGLGVVAYNFGFLNKHKTLYPNIKGQDIFLICFIIIIITIQLIKYIGFKISTKIKHHHEKTQNKKINFFPY